ncbi:DUF6916 family protein [Agrobacterium bohemicum]|uniref:DUF6916 domain-containing protein n=1 Tax=Agrobacterium bohemicum TaxID=2052828 RepID=A0A135P4H7_9HYPH|nr:hypothetical protein ATO67_22060 [Agrobacterium bohemicum]
MDIQRLSAEVFLPHIGADFSLLGDGDTVLMVKLADCRKYPRGTMPGTARTAFRLLFETAANQMPPRNDGIFTIQHETIGTVGPVHIGRVISDRADTAVLEIIFN